MTNLDLLAFPQELLIQILSNLDGIAIARCAMTCRRIHETLKNSYLLKYIVQLHCNGVTDSGGTFLTQRLSHPELIERLQRRHQEWMSPKWTVDMRLELYCDYDPFDLVGGALVKRSLNRLQITMLPTAGSNVGGLHTIERVLNNESEFGAECHTMDPTRDVIMLLKINYLPRRHTHSRNVYIHIRTLSSDDPHPLAQRTPLQFTVPPNIEREDFENAHLAIARNTLVLRFYNAFEDMCELLEPRALRVLVWDWTTSELILDFSNSLTKPLLPSVKFGFGLINSTYCFFTSVFNSGSIQLYELGKFTTSGAPALHHLTTLHLPRTIPNVTIRKIHNHAGPIETYPLPHSAPFMVNDDDRLHMFRIDYFSEGLNAGKGLSMPTNLFVHQRVFTKYCMQKKQQARIKHDDVPLDIPWEEWGPSNTRIIFPSCTLPERSRHYKHVYGQRVVCHKLRHYDDLMYDELVCPAYPTNTILVLDFSPAAVLSATGILPIPSSSNSSSRPGKLLPPSKISSSQVLLYEDDVETCLPCVSLTADLEQSYESYMIHADGVVGVNIAYDMEAVLLDVYAI